MGAFKTFGPFPVELNGGAIVIDQITSIRINPDVVKLFATPGGQVDPAMLATASARPMATITTTDLKTVLENFTFVQPLTLGTGFSIYLQTRKDCDDFDVPAKRLFALKGCAILDNITAEAETTIGATATISLHANWDGANLPLQCEDVANVPANLPVHESTFILGLVALDDNAGGITEVTGVQRVQVQSGIQLEKPLAAGDPYPRYTFVTQRQASALIDLLDPDEICDGINGWRIFHACPVGQDLDVYLQEVAECADRTPIGQASHIKISGPAVHSVMRSLDANAQQLGTVQYEMFYTKPDAVTDALTVTVDETIPTPTG